MLLSSEWFVYKESFFNPAKKARATEEDISEAAEFLDSTFLHVVVETSQLAGEMSELLLLFTVPNTKYRMTF